MRRMMLMLGLMALAACGAHQEPGEAPRPSPGPGGALDGPLVLDVSGNNTPSLYGLIGERQRLGLTGAQVTTLDSLAIVLNAANDSLRSYVRETWDGDRPRAGTERWERTRPALEQIGRNNRAASLAVQNLLSEDQRRIACEMQAEQRARRPPEPVRLAPRGARRIGGRRREAPADSATLR
ncbi:MAG TPA: hypothetical protein VHG93_06790, partial [Longimicrobium sp.]|nr:hypothetical protein [Longimicrobium sp.]